MALPGSPSWPAPASHPPQLPDLTPLISQRGEEGFSSCSMRCVTVLSLPAPPERVAASARLRRPVLPSRGNRPLGLRALDVSGPTHVHLRYGPVTRSPSLRWLCR